MMTVSVELSGPIRTEGGRRKLELELPVGALVADALEAAGIPREQQRFLSLTMGERRVRPTTRLREGDRLRAHLVAGGG